MTSTDHAKRRRFLANTERWLPAFIAFVSIIAWTTGCQSSATIRERTQRALDRVGQSRTFPYPYQTVTNALAAWAKTLTNGYKLEAHRRFDLSTNTPERVFVVRNENDPFALWGMSKCLPSGKNYFRAEIFIRTIPVEGGVRVSVAIHGRHIVRGLTWNIHTFEFEHTKSADLRQCPADEDSVLEQLESFVK